MRNSSWFYWTLGAAILAIAAGARLYDAQSRLFHADEGVQAYQAWRLIETGEYRYNPNEHHGPTLYYFARWLYPLIRDEAGELDDFRIRLVPFVFGVGCVAAGLVALRRSGPEIALLWGILIAIAPLPVIYGAYFAQESLLAFFTLATLFVAVDYLRRPHPWRAAAVGLGAGLMVATKETAVLHLVAMGGALLALRSSWQVSWRKAWRDAALASGVAVVVAGLFFSSWGRNPDGVWDAVTAYANYAGRAEGQGHAKGAFYYLGILLPQTKEGARWGELALLFCAALGIVFQGIGARRGRLRDTRVGFAFSVMGLVLLLLYSLIPYKTPWLLLTPYLSLTYLAAFGLKECFQLASEAGGWRRFAGGIAAVALMCWTMSEMTFRCYQATVRYPSASRNPYLYQHTTPRYTRLLERILQLRAQSDDSSWSAGVYSPDFAWPLPWHLRHFERVGYWESLDGFTPHSVDVIDTRLLGDAIPQGDGEAVWELYGLRPNALISLRIARAREPIETGSEESP